MKDTSTPETMSLYDLDILINERLNKAEIVFYENKDIKTVEDAIENFRDELLSRNYWTVSIFLRNCFNPLYNLISELSIDFFEEYSSVFIMVIGYYKAMGAFDRTSAMNDPCYLKKMKGLFSEEEIRSIQEGVKKLLSDFKRQIINCKNNTLKDRIKEQDQMKVLINFVRAMSEGKDEYALDQIRKQADIQTLTSMWAKQRLGEAIGSPARQLFLTTVRLFNYLEVLTNSGYVNTASCAGEFKWLKAFG